MKNNKYNWINHYFKIKPASLLTKDLLNIYINQFWKEIVIKINDNQHILLLSSLQWTNGEFATIGQLQKLNKEDKDYLLNYLLNIIEIKSDTYISEPLMSLTFSYGIREGLAEEKIVKTDVKYQTYYHYKLPISFDPLKYGKLLHQINNNYIIQLKSNNTVIINSKDKINKVKLFKNGNLVYEWIDRYINDSTFIREIGKNKYTYSNNELKLLTVEKPSKFIKPIKKSKNINNKILTMDLETRVIIDKYIPYCLKFKII